MAGLFSETHAARTTNHAIEDVSDTREVRVPALNSSPQLANERFRECFDLVRAREESFALVQIQHLGPRIH